MLAVIECMLGIQHATRASHKLFTSKALLSDGAGQYPSVSQKYLKAAASRIFIYFMVVLAEEQYSASGDAMDECRLQTFRAIAAMLTVFAEHGLQGSKKDNFQYVKFFRNPSLQLLK